MQKILKVCAGCNLELTFRKFTDSYSHSDGKNPLCKSCSLKKRNQSKLERLELIKQGFFKCTVCNEVRELNEFRLNTGQGNKCRTCRNKLVSLHNCRYPEVGRANRKKHFSKRREISQKSYRKHRFKALVLSANYKSKKDSTGEKIAVGQVWSLAKKQKLKCAISGVKLNNRNISVDHIIPFAKDGKNTIENIQLVHVLLNRAKSDLLPDEFLTELMLIFLS